MTQLEASFILISEKFQNRERLSIMRNLSLKSSPSRKIELKKLKFIKVHQVR